MALPTAQLGAMANLNTPSYVPVQVIPRQPTIWQQALASFLTNTAGDVGQRLVTNEMEPEHAAEFGQTPTSGWDRLMHGAAVNDKEAAQMRDINSATSLLGTREAGENTRLGLSETGANTRNSADLASRASEGTANRGLTQSEGIASRQAAHDQQVAEIQARMDQQKSLFANENITAVPKMVADVNEANARAILYGQQADTARRTAALIPQPPTTPVKAAINPNIAAFAQSGPVAPAAQPTSDADMIQSMLARGMSPDDATNAMQTLRDKQQGVQNIAMQRGQQTDDVAATKAAIIQSILQRLHPNPGAASINDFSPY